MSPLGIKIVLWYYYCATDYVHDCQPGRNYPDVVHQMMDHLISENILCMSLDKYLTYCLTDRGKAYVNFLLEMPFPQQSWIWIMPIKEVK